MRLSRLMVVPAATLVVLGLGLSALFLGTSGTKLPTRTVTSWVGDSAQPKPTSTNFDCGRGSETVAPPGAAVAGATVTVPNVVGESTTQAETALHCAGFKYTLLSVPTQSAPAGSILDQSPAAGAMTELPGTVHLTVAFG